MENHDVLLAGLVHLSAVIYILMIIFNALGGIGYKGIVLNLRFIAYCTHLINGMFFILLCQKVFFRRVWDKFPTSTPCT